MKNEKKITEKYLDDVNPKKGRLETVMEEPVQSTKVISNEKNKETPKHKYEGISKENPNDMFEETQKHKEKPEVSHSENKQKMSKEEHKAYDVQAQGQHKKMGKKRKRPVATVEPLELPKLLCEVSLEQPEGIREIKNNFLEENKPYCKVNFLIESDIMIVK